MLCLMTLLLVGFRDIVFSQDYFDAEEDSSLIVMNIVIMGNTKTKDIVILREMKTKTGDFFDLALMEEDRKRIQNLHLFTRVEIAPDFKENGVILNITVAERWYIFPYPILYRNEKDWKKLSYGAGIIHQNFRGLNHNIISSFWFGYNPGMDFYYSNPWLGGKKQLSYNFKVYSYKVRNKSLYYDRFDENHKGFYLSFGKRWGYHLYLTAAVAYRNIHVPEKYKGITYSGNVTDHLPSVGLSFRYDKRDLYEYPKKGLLVDLYINKTKYKSQLDYYRYGVDLRRYQPIYQNISLAIRAAMDLTTSAIPAYNHIYIGYLDRIRGEFNTRLEGENRLIGNVELRFPIIKIRYFNLESNADMLGEYSNNLPLGLSGGIFFDTGTVWFHDEKLNDQKLLSGFGFGLHFHVPYFDLLRLEYAFDTNYNPQVIFDVGVAF
ncbi:BamA/TamA family outer membrane protein [candidate division KSB1 bacterium]|nr:BamA/TamA family outer membrane protein [candidate division KSB1 bacterium]